MTDLFFWSGAAWAVKGGNFLADDWVLRSFVYVDLRPMSIVLGHVGVGEDCFDGTFGHARIAIYTGVGVDVKTVGQFMKCFNRTNGCAVGVLAIDRSEEHTSELQSRLHLVCRLLLEKKNTKKNIPI